ncbi:HNH endonuclease [Burkholderia sp. Bp9142]|uniref:HNH endonuclease n=1 Tax=Burkholderia sp. Bp9142 TaxID=2184573 RepID=UPI000F59A893|nr:HNH endonuclease signature motif containing protein [Burkholderia sp. Bp9142]RQR27297.1 HNH endonuclease [Burkholderia sp. Bp9142]
MSRVFREEKFVQYNGFYGKPHCRSVVFHLYEGECVTCRRQIEGDNFHVAHIIARSHPALMEKYFSYLDVDNLLNLKLSCPRCNSKESNFVVDALMLQGAFNSSARVISSRLDTVLETLQAVVKRIEMNGADPRICTDMLYIDANEIRTLASDWHGALVVPRAELDTRVAEAMRSKLGNDGAEWDTYHAVEEAIGLFRNRMEIRSCCSYSIHSDGSLPWLNEAKGKLFREGEFRPIRETVQAAGLIEGVYLDPDELSERGGLLFPLRTEVQRWFRDIFATIIQAKHKLDRGARKKYHVLDEHEWRSICECFDKLSIIESGIGKVGRRLRIPDIIAHFGMQQNKLCFGDDNISIPDEVRHMCRAVATDSAWGDGALILKSKFRPWLARAFSIADLAVDQAIGSRLVLVGDERSFCRRWMPRLPKLDGKTREEVRLESSTRSTRLRKRAAH